MELVNRVVRQRGLAQAFVSLPRLRETRLCLPFISSGVHQERRPVRRHW